MRALGTIAAWFGRPGLVLAAAAPLVLAVGLLELFGPSSGPLGKAELQRLGTALVKGDFLPGEITFLAVVTAHVFACLVAIAMALHLLRRTPQSVPFARMGVLLALVVAVAVPAMMIGSTASAGRISFGAFAAFFAHAQVAAPFARPLFAGGPSPLALAIVVPTAFGVAAVAMMSAAANAQLQLFHTIFESRGQQQAARVRQLHERMKRCLYTLAVVLVTSTVSASIFFHLPSRVALAPGVAPKGVEAALAARFADFAAELSLFWGVIYTLTLAAAVGLPLFLLQARVRRALEPPPLSKASRDQRELLITSGVLDEGREQVKFFTTLLAPLVAGPVANLLQTTTLF
jgi:hypothetical protein